MAKQVIGLGSAANDNTGDTLRAGGDKVNDNFSEVYTALGNGTDLTITLANPGVNQVLRYNGSTFTPSDYSTLTSSLDVNGNTIISTSNGNIPIAPNGTGNVLIKDTDGLMKLSGSVTTSTIGTKIDGVPVSDFGTNGIWQFADNNTNDNIIWIYRYKNTNPHNLV